MIIFKGINFFSFIKNTNKKYFYFFNTPSFSFKILALSYGVKSSMKTVLFSSCYESLLGSA